MCVCDKIIVLLVLFFEEKDFFFVRKLLFFKRTDEGIFWLFLCSLFRCFSSCKFIIYISDMNVSSSILARREKLVVSYQAAEISCQK